MSEERTYLGVQYTLARDEDPPHPDDADDYAFLVYDHRNFCIKRDGYKPEDIFEIYNSQKENGWRKFIYQDYWIFPVYAYIHSGVSLSLGRGSYPFNDPWDVSFRGFALIKKETGFAYRHKRAFERAQSLIDVWNCYLSGDVWIIDIPEYSECTGGYYGKERAIAEAECIIKLFKHGESIQQDAGLQQLAP